jgi:phytoene dehydrogenase-like protein
VPERFDAVVVGSGPNGLAAAIELARSGAEVLLVEGCDELGGGLRSAELTQPGFLHDVCSAVHPLGELSPFFRGLPLERHGLAFAHPKRSVAHPLDDQPAVLIERSLSATAAGLGADAGAYEKLLAPFVRIGAPFYGDLMAPLRIPSHPFAMARFGYYGVRSAAGLARASVHGGWLRS